MRVGIIIPTYNVATYLPETIATVQAQTVTDWRLALVDNGSTDDTVVIASAAAARDARISVLHETKRGPSAARNLGLRLLAPQASYIAYLDGDDIWKPDALETLIGCMDDHPEAIGAHGMFYAMNDDGSPQPDGVNEYPYIKRYGCRRGLPVPLDDSAPTTFADQLVQNNIPIQAAMVRSAYALADEGFDESLTGFEDWEYWLRVTQQGPMAYSSKLITGYRRHGQGLSNQGANMEACRLAALRKLFKARKSGGGSMLSVRVPFVAGELLCARRRLRYTIAALANRDARSTVEQYRHAQRHIVAAVRGTP